MRTIRLGAADSVRDHLPAADLLFAVGVWGTTVTFLPLQGAGLGVALLGAMAVLFIGCVWVPRRSGADLAKLGWRLPVVTLSLLIGMAVVILGVSPMYASLGEVARLGCIYASVVLVGVASYILKKLPPVAPVS